MKTRRKAKDVEFEIHVWAKPETRNMVAVYTISRGNFPICVDMPLDEALDSLRSTLEDAA